MPDLVIGVGSNLGDRRENIREALARVEALVGPMKALSTLIETDPVGFESPHRFLNGVAVFGDLLPESRDVAVRLGTLLAKLQSVETFFGRERTGIYADRAIDLDILFYGREIIRLPVITVPHPRLHERGFVLQPLAEVCGEWVHPVLGRTVGELWEEFRGK